MRPLIAGELDREQAAAVEAFAAAGDRALSYAELGERGVSRPASVGYELAAAGWPITRSVVTDTAGRRHLGLRMLPHEQSAVPAAVPRRTSLLPVIGGLFR